MSNDPKLQYFFKHHELIEASSKGTKSRPELSVGFFQKCSELAHVFPFALKILLAPKNSTILFNHSSRQRKGNNGSSSLYASRLAEKIPNLLLIEDKASTIQYGRKVTICNADWIPRFTGIFRRLDRKHSPALAIFLVKKAIWKIVFRWLKPKQIFLVVWYGKEWAVAAAKDLQIPVVELQHGIVYEAHPFYRIAADQNVVGSDYLLPDQVWVYGKYWAEKFCKMGWHPNKVSVCGMYLDISIKRGQDLPKQPYILYTSQPGFNEAVRAHVQSIHGELMRRGMIAVIATHPAEAATVYDDLVGDHIKVFANLDSYDLLSACSAHISLFSTLLIEAILFDKPSYQIDMDYGSRKSWNIDDLVELGINKKIKVGEFPALAVAGQPSQDKERVNYFFENMNQRIFNSTFSRPT